MSFEREIDNWPDELIGGHISDKGYVDTSGDADRFPYVTGEAGYSYGGLSGFSGGIPAKRKNPTAVLGRNGRQP